ncbi:uncharacterized protein LOC115444927 [Manduca sexta]|uniref:PEHE domain-containing protein n=1 Tax=Manduca sexta TaxID=7130 RepID=A0A921Z874_MANSE|nr:uncharacterized protein LOC115444927 [Manduca sexta]KAG6452289.1 hypothetical protein O3G_MSEX007573 [Manduca sexta]
MNNRSSVNESNLVSFATDLPTLNQLDTKDSLLSFPFDHIYACHSDSSDRRQTLQLDKEVEISTHCVVEEEKDLLVSPSPEVNQLSTKLTAAESQNKKLKELLIYHLDLIQQQNDLMTKREKVYQALKQENDTLKTKLNRMDKKAPANQRQSVNPPPLVNVVPTTATSTVVKTEPSPSSQIMFNSFTELLLPDSQTNSYIFNSDINKSKAFTNNSVDITRSSESDVTSFLPTDWAVPSMSILDSNLNCDNFTMIENKRSYVKKESAKPEPRPEPLYTVTSNSGNPVIQKIQRNRRRTSGIGSLSRMSRNTTPKVEMPDTSKMFEDEKSFDRNYSVNKKNKVNTYGKSRSTIPKKTTQFTGSLSDRLQLIDTTPTGEDPYQLGEADMREQSPIPKLMLQKSHHGRMKLSSDNPSTATSTRRIYDPAIPETTTKPLIKPKVERYSLSSTFVPEPKKELPKTLMEGEPDMDLVKSEPDLDWQMFSTSKTGNETSLCDFSYGENSSNLATSILPGLDSVEFQDLFNADSPLNLDTLNPVDFTPITENNNPDKSKQRGARTTSLLSPEAPGGSGLSAIPDFASPEAVDFKRGTESKRGRKRAMSATGVTKAKRDPTPKQAAPKPKPVKGKAVSRGKKPAVPGMMTSKPYHTLMGDPDLSWYLGLDPDIKFEDIDPTEDPKASTVEVPRWREKPYTSCYTLEGTENLDDKVFEKRHQKLEAEERRQLRWHMRRVREQRHVERLRLRQRDSWCGGSASPAYQQPSIYTIWPQPQRDARFIEITDSLPVMAFGEILPALPETDFMLPWVRTSKALKRAKRSKTLH